MELAYKLMDQVAKCLVKNNIKIIRGHAYKPLTFSGLLNIKS